ncbi:MAG: hypothetical protein HY860_04380 [Chlamydiales bacterium]|nr:hypothetical protein [Chlamydiales bacterium]
MSDIFHSLLKPWTYGRDILETSYNIDSWKFVIAHTHTPNKTNAKTCSLISNQVTGNFYQKDSSSLVAWKCFAIMIATPLFITGKILYHTVKIVVDVAMIFFSQFAIMVEHIADGQNAIGCIIEFIRDSIIENSFMVGSHLWQISRLAWYSIGLELAAIGGFLSDPLQARQQIGIIERKINYAPRHYDIRFGCSKPDRVFYLAYCFQPVRNLMETFDNGGTTITVDQEFSTYSKLKQAHNWVADRIDIACCPFNRCCSEEMA